MSRSLAACEGALLVVDATQGVEAQTVANVYLAVDNDLEVFPVLNKMDLASADPERVKEQIEEIVGIDTAHALAVSAKDGRGVDEVLEAMVQRIPPPAGDPDAPLSALIFDSWYDSFRGVVMLVRVSAGVLRPASGSGSGPPRPATRCRRWPSSRPTTPRCNELGAGEVGVVVAGIKEIAEARVGDTVTHDERPCAAPLPGFERSSRWCSRGSSPPTPGRTPSCGTPWASWSSTTPPSPTSPRPRCALGFGFRCGFLGLLHMEIVQERLEREYDLDLVVTAPSVRYRVHATDGERDRDRQPVPAAGRRAARVRRGALHPGHHPHAPRVRGRGAAAVRGEARHPEGHPVPVEQRVVVEYELPLAEVVMDFYDKLKSAPAATPPWTTSWQGFERNDLVRLDILVNGDPLDAPGRHLPPRQDLLPRARSVPQAQGADPAADVRGGDPGGHRHARSSRGPPSRRCARTSPPSATAAISRASGSCWRSRRRVRSG